jgi:hypothetical protein
MVEECFERVCFDALENNHALSIVIQTMQGTDDVHLRQKAVDVAVQGQALRILEEACLDFMNQIQRKKEYMQISCRRKMEDPPLLKPHLPKEK